MFSVLHSSDTGLPERIGSPQDPCSNSSPSNLSQPFVANLKARASCSDPMMLTANCFRPLKISKQSALLAKHTRISGGVRDRDENADAVKPYSFHGL